jgi:cysteinyl-tRNA synthetase
VHVARDAPGSGQGGDAALIGVGPVEDLTHRATDGNRGDLLALRLALLSCPYRQPVTLTQAALADAAASASRWRHRVAEWASQPSRPVPAEAATAIRDAFDDDLNTVAALRLLHNMESRPDIPAGAKFETFLFVDRVLGLELPREIGH